VRPWGEVQVMGPVGCRWGFQCSWVLRLWSRWQRGWRLLRVVGPWGQGVMWSSWEWWAGRVQPGMVQVG